MTISTLEYIHKLLIEEERKTNKDYQGARHLQHEYESRSEFADLIKRQTEAADDYMHKHIAAANALEDFEQHEW